MTVPFMRAYTELLVRTCHRRGAHAIGGMAAFIPNRRDPEVTETALAKVRDDKLRESRDGFDGTWVAHPDLVPVAMEIFDGVLGERAEPEGPAARRGRRHGRRSCSTSTVAGGAVTEAGIRANIRVALAYLDAWLRGNGAAAIDNLMEDAATAEIARSQLWLWRSPRRCSRRERYAEIRDEELARLGGGAARAAWPTPETCSTAWSSTSLRRVPDPAGVLAARTRVGTASWKTTQQRPGCESSTAWRCASPRASSAPSARARFMPQTSGRCSSTSASNGQFPSRISPDSFARLVAAAPEVRRRGPRGAVAGWAAAPLPLGRPCRSRARQRGRPTARRRWDVVGGSFDGLGEHRRRQFVIPLRGATRRSSAAPAGRAWPAGRRPGPTVRSAAGTPSSGGRPRPIDRDGTRPVPADTPTAADASSRPTASVWLLTQS